MAWRPHSHAKVDSRSPRAWARCDFCNDIYNHHELTWQVQWSGVKLQNLRFLVCHKCKDVPQPQLKARILPPDPVPVQNARPWDYAASNNTYLVTDDGTPLGTDDGTNIVTTAPDPIP